MNEVKLFKSLGNLHGSFPHATRRIQRIDKEFYGSMFCVLLPFMPHV